MPSPAPEDRPEAATAAQPAEAPAGAVHIKLPVFEGPLDLLLHLIRTHELDIMDIPVSFVTQRYLEYLDLMRSLQIDVASEYLVMAATLLHIKSRMLLPGLSAGDEGEGEEAQEGDPRAELVRRLLEYQKYKQAAQEIGERATLGRDVFGRGAPEPLPEGPAPFAPVSVFRLFDAFRKLLERAQIGADHHVLFERISIAERIGELQALIEQAGRVRFEELFERVRLPAGAGESISAAYRFELVITFLALLEMCRLHLIELSQDGPLGQLHIALRPGARIAPADLAALSGPGEAPRGDQPRSAPLVDWHAALAPSDGDEASDAVGDDEEEDEEHA